MKKILRIALGVTLLLAGGALVSKVYADWPDCNPLTQECIP